MARSIENERAICVQREKGTRVHFPLFQLRPASTRQTGNGVLGVVRRVRKARSMETTILCTLPHNPDGRIPRLSISEHVRRSEERRVGKDTSSRGQLYHEKKKMYD